MTVPFPAACETEGPDATAEEADQDLTGEEMDRAVDFVVQAVTGRDDFTGAISRKEIEEATGVVIPDSALDTLQTSVIRELQERFPAVLARLSEGSRCSDYGACSFHGNLAGATGDTLKMYEREKAEDGTFYGDFRLPDFESRDLQGNVVRAADLRGQPTVLTLLAGHCTHSHDSLPILQKAVETWGGQGLRVVGILVNSGSVKDVNEWITRTDPGYEVWVHEDASLGELLGSHLVPTYLFVDADGRVTRKLVGFKELDEVMLQAEALMTDPDSIDPEEMGTARGAR